MRTAAFVGVRSTTEKERERERETGTGGSLATITQEFLKPCTAALRDVLAWYRHSYFVRDARICHLIAPELERWLGSPTTLVHVTRALSQHESSASDASESEHIRNRRPIFENEMFPK